MIHKILVVEDREDSLKMILSNLKVEGIPAASAKNAEDALKQLKETPFCLILSDLKLPQKSGLELLQEVKILYPSISFIIMTAYGDVSTAVQAIQKGANDFVEKPLEMDILINKIQQLLRIQQLEQENDNLKKINLPSLIGETQTIQQIRQDIEKISKQSLNCRILILGESGTGKEVVARRIHMLSSRRENPFVPVNCTAIPEGIWESEVFGHEKDAYTGANSAREGYFQQAHTGTLFLDEIGDIPLSPQSKLLRVLESGEVTRLGSNAPEKVDVQIICATNIDLLKMVELQKFRKDLYYRINGVQINLPPLRDRLEDIPLLVHFIINQSQFETSYEVSEKALQKLQEWPWPGNVRELSNVIQRTITLLPSNTTLIDVKHLKFEENHSVSSSPLPIVFNDNSKLKEIRDKAIHLSESYHIQQILEQVEWNRSKAAKQLGVSYKTLLEKIKSYELSPPEDDKE